MEGDKALTRDVICPKSRRKQKYQGQKAALLTPAAVLCLLSGMSAEPTRALGDGFLLGGAT